MSSNKKKRSHLSIISKAIILASISSIGLGDDVNKHFTIKDENDENGKNEMITKNIILEVKDSAVEVVDHRSHYSHRSHGSHASHGSHRSHRIKH